MIPFLLKPPHNLHLCGCSVHRYGYGLPKKTQGSPVSCPKAACFVPPLPASSPLCVLSPSPPHPCQPYSTPLQLVLHIREGSLSLLSPPRREPRIPPLTFGVREGVVVVAVVIVAVAVVIDHVVVVVVVVVINNII